jgi:hypothetical protein
LFSRRQAPRAIADTPEGVSGRGRLPIVRANPALMFPDFLDETVLANVELQT